MADAFICDRCEEHYPGNPFITLSAKPEDRDAYPVPTPYSDLCEECADELKTFFRSYQELDDD